MSVPIRIVFGGREIASTGRAWRVLETHHPPTYYLPPDAFAPGALGRGSPRRSFCEWKGIAEYRTVRSGDRRAIDAAWCYPAPSAAFAAIRDHVAVYPAMMDGCFVGALQAMPQPGGFYGGWVTPDLVGPFKGAPGTEAW